MKSLLILRHGKSSWKDRELRDSDRPLKRRGERAAEAMGQQLRQRDLVPDLALSSPAQRARETARLALAAAGYGGPIVCREELYLSGLDRYLGVLAALEDAHERVLVVGHNPVLEDLAQHLTRIEVVLPTAALVHIALDLDSWAGIRDARGEQRFLLLPRMLEQPGSRN